MGSVSISKIPGAFCVTQGSPEQEFWGSSLQICQQPAGWDWENPLARPCHVWEVTAAGRLCTQGRQRPGVLCFGTAQASLPLSREGSQTTDPTSSTSTELLLHLHPWQLLAALAVYPGIHSKSSPGCWMRPCEEEAAHGTCQQAGHCQFSGWVPADNHLQAGSHHVGPWAAGFLRELQPSQHSKAPACRAWGCWPVLNPHSPSQNSTFTCSSLSSQLRVPLLHPYSQLLDTNHHQTHGKTTAGSQRPGSV